MVGSVTDKLYRIANREESPIVIDTPEEWMEAVLYLSDDAILSPKDKYYFSETKQVLDVFGPEGRFQVNTLRAGRRGGVSLLIPLPEEVAVVFQVYSGAMFGNYLEEVFVSLEDWEFIVEPLKMGSVADAKLERRALEDVFARFEEVVSPKEDVPGLLGNLIPGRGQQDCVDKSRGTAQGLDLLARGGMLRYHTFDPSAPYSGNPTFHMGSRMTEKATGQHYVVDTWNGTVHILWDKLFVELYMDLYGHRPKW